MPEDVGIPYLLFRSVLLHTNTVSPLSAPTSTHLMCLLESIDVYKRMSWRVETFSRGLERIMYPSFLSASLTNLPIVFLNPLLK